jgi:hypothetical protein
MEKPMLKCNQQKKRLNQRTKRSLTPMALCLCALTLRLKGKLSVEPPPTGLSASDSGESLVPFRKIVIRDTQDNFDLAPVLLEVRFRFRNLPMWLNRLLSWIPVPLIVSQPGFISKTWFQKMNTSEFMGVYEFDNLRNAFNYWHSLPIRMMSKRAAKNTLHGEIILFDFHKGKYVHEPLEHSANWICCIPLHARLSPPITDIQSRLCTR